MYGENSLYNTELPKLEHELILSMYLPSYTPSRLYSNIEHSLKILWYTELNQMASKFLHELRFCKIIFLFLSLRVYVEFEWEDCLVETYNILEIIIYTVWVILYHLGFIVPGIDSKWWDQWHELYSWMN